MGRIRRENKQPHANGINKLKLRFAIPWITGAYTPKTTNMALPEIPGIKKNEKAANPAINKYIVVISPEPKLNFCKPSPIKIPANKNNIKLGLWNKALKKSAV